MFSGGPASIARSTSCGAAAPDPVLGCPCRGAGTAGASGLPDFPCPSSAAVSREVDLDLEPACGRSCCRCRARGMGLRPRAGNCRWRAAGAVWAPHSSAVCGDAGASAVAQRVLVPSVPQHLLGGRPIPGLLQGARPRAGLGSPTLVDRPRLPVGLRWCAGLWRCRVPGVLLAALPGAADFCFFVSCSSF